MLKFNRKFVIPNMVKARKLERPLNIADFPKVNIDNVSCRQLADFSAASLIAGVKRIAS